MSELPFYRFEIMEHIRQTPQCYASFNILFFLQGSASVQFQNQLISLKQHNFVFFNLYEIHQFLSVSPDARCLLVLIHDHYLKKAAPEILSCSFHTHAVTQDSEAARYQYFCREFGRFLYHHTVYSPGSQLQCLKHLGNLLAYSMDHLSVPSDSGSLLQRKERLFLALNYISENYKSELSLPIVAEQVGLHPQYFSRYFKQQTGMTLTEYINQLRIVNSLSDLIHSDRSILEIALDSGFNNYKTYSTAFRKVLHTTPHAWQKELLLAHQEQSASIENTSIFSFFQKYWKKDARDLSDSLPSGDLTRTIELNGSTTVKPGRKAKAADPFPEFCYSIGQAADLLRGDIQQQLRDVAGELPVRQLRLRNVFSDNLFVYYETPEKTAVYNWQYLDMIYDFLTELQIKPYTELGFTPRMLASKQQFANWQHRPNVSFPRSLKNWSRLVENFLRHLLQRYGKEEVLTWKFHLWTSADLDMKGGYWHESMESFFLFYRVTYNAAKTVDERLLFGGPDFSIPNGLSWYRAFFDYCREYELLPDFLTVHLYAEHPSHTDEMMRNRYVAGAGGRSLGTSGTLYQSFFDFLDMVAMDRTFHNFPIVVSDWNHTFHSRDYARDTCFMSALIAETFRLLSGTRVTTLGFRSLCDVNEDFFPEERLFCGGPGLLDIHGLKKASYYAFVLLNRLGKERISSGENYLFTRNGRGDSYQLLLFHPVYPVGSDETLPTLLSYEQRYDCYKAAEPLSLCMILNLPAGHYRLKQTEISRTCGSAYDLWVQMGSPQGETKTVLDYIRAKALPGCCFREADVSSHLVIPVELPAAGVILIEIERE